MVDFCLVLCAAVAAGSLLNPEGSAGKGLLLEHQQHIQVYSPNKKLVVEEQQGDGGEHKRENRV